MRNCLLKKIHLVQPKKSWIGMRLILALFMLTGIWQEAAAADYYLGIDKVKFTNKIASEGYVELELPVYESAGSDEGLKAASLTVNGTKVIEFYTLENVDDKWQSVEADESDEYIIWIQAKVSDGYGVIQNKEGTGFNKLSNGYSEYTLKQSKISGGFWITTAIFRWYVSADLAEKELNFGINLTIDYNGDNQDPINSSNTFGSYTPPVFNAPELNLNFSQTPGKYTVSYSNLSTPKAGSQGKWDNDTPFNSTSPTGSKEYDVKDVEQTSIFTYYYKLHDYASVKKEKEVPLPAFHKALNFKAENTTNGNTKLTWNIANTGLTNCQTGDKFEVQRSMDNLFTTPVAVGSFDFKADNPTYEVIDQTGLDNLNGTVYYRIRRTKHPSWNWGWSETCNIQKTMSHQSITELKADDITKAGENIQVKVAWKLSELTDNTVWTDGAKIIIRQVNATQNNMTSYTYELENNDNRIKKDESGYFYIIDEEIYATCMEYKYFASVRPGNKKYEESPSIEAQYISPIKPISIGEVETLIVSKGYFPDRIDLRWETDNMPISRFAIQRRLYDPGVTNSDVGFENISNGLVQSIVGQTNYMGTDETANPGNIYEYRILAQTDCAGEVKSSTSPIVRGFRSPTGIISGRITYGYGDAVPGVDVILSSKELKSGQSLLFSGIDNSYTETDQPIASPVYMTIQAYIKPTTEKQTATIIDAGKYRLGLQDGKAAFSANGGTDWTIADTAIPTGAFSQLTGLYDGSSIKIYVGGELKKEIQQNGLVGDATEAKVTIGKGFAGYVDEVRLWNKGLTKEEVKQTYNRILAGNEVGLIAYWRLNDPVVDEFYDLSYSIANYNARHGKIHNAELKRGEHEYPTDTQLALRGVTDGSGNYTVSGIPYEGQGTAYTLTPTYPNHTFSPTENTITIGPGATIVSNQDFKNNSAVKIEGYVYYENSSIPVVGATFEINGQPVTSQEEFVKSGPDGKFTFSVPVGSQTVRVVMANHVFKNGGKLIDSKGLNLNYQQPLANLRFWDQTKVKLIGRMAGGTVEEAKPLGFSLSKNNLGDDMQLVLELEGNKTASIYDKGAVYNEDGTENENAPKEMDSTMVHWNSKYDNRVSYHKDKIVITPNSETGEYEAWLYPVKYAVTDATVKGWEGLLPEAKPAVELTNVFVEQTSEYTDEEKNITYRLSFNEKYNLIHRVNPSISYKQGNAGGATVDYFGLPNYIIPHLDGSTPDTLRLYDKTTKKYLFGQDKTHLEGLPVFSVGKYGFHIEATENYLYNGTEAAVESKEDRVPTQGGDVSITNGFHTTNATQKLKLDDNGRLYVEVGMDKPKFASNDLGQLTIAVKIGEKTYTAPVLEGYLIGSDNAEGTDFVTAGPITLLNILRDPPGSASYSWWEKGHTYSYSNTSGRGFTNTGSNVEAIMLGVEVTTGTGIGAFTILTSDSENTLSLGVIHEETTNFPQARTMSVTTTSNYQTSDDPLNVGSAADVFIGFSNNIFYGPVRSVDILDEAAFNGIGNKNKESYQEVTVNGKMYHICSNMKLNVATSASTLFSYSKIHIEEKVIPGLEELRNSLLLPKEDFTEAQAKAMADNQNRIIYLSKRNKDDENFGANNSNGTSDGDSYKAIIPNGGVPEVKVEESLFGKTITVTNGAPDSVYMYNNSIHEWHRVLKQNEDEKLAAIRKADYVERNRSFHAAAPVEYSEEFAMARDSGYTYSFMASALISGKTGFAVNGVGFQTQIEQTFGGTGDFEQTSGEENTSASGFVLADEGDFDYIRVDVLRAAPVDTSFKQKWDDIYEDLKDQDYVKVEPKENTQYGNFIFRTRGGATACPYEPAEYTQYQDGNQQLLGEATLQIERPDIAVEKPVITNVPSDQAAVFNLKLMNDSKVAGATAIFTIAIVDAANQKGAKFSIDGVPLGEGRGIEVPYGEVLNKVLEVRRGTEYDYEDLALVLKSQCQSDPTDYQADIADTVYISAHFIPSSSDINIKNPTDKWTLNTNASYDSISGKYYMALTIDGFDVNFTGFDHIELQYKPSSGSDKDWTNICSYFNDSIPYKAASGTKEMLDGVTITNRFFGAEDQKYDIRAVTFSKVGNEFVTKSSPILSGIKDTKRPVVFGNIQPADGVLGIEDEIRLNFNEEIAERYMTEVKNFQVTAIRNGSNGDHSTSLTFDGKAAYLVTQAERNLANKDLTVEMWVLPALLGQEMTLFSHGTSSEAFELSIGADKSIKVRIGNKEYASKPQDFKTTDWAHVSMSYKASNRQLSAYFGGVEVITGVETESYTASGPMMFGRSVRGGNLFAGKMHEARVWNKVVSSNNIVANKLTIYTGQEAGMLAYYPMNEGKGDMATDKAQGATAFIHGAEWSTLEGLSLAFKGDTILSVNTSQVALTDEKDYTLEFWFKADAGQKNAALVSNGKGIGEENNTSRNKVFVGFEEGKLLFRNNGHQEMVTGNWIDDNWHHFAISVNRNAGNAQIFIDGVLNCYFDAGKLGGFSATNLYLGARCWTEADQMVDHTDMYLKGQIDELRLWNMALPSTYIGNNYNVCPKGTEMGLMAYLPFSKYIRNSANVQELVFGGEDLVTGEALVDASGEKFSSTAKAPVRAKGPEVSIPFTFVVNKDALVINLMDTPEALEKTVVNFTVKDVSDLNGNLLQSPITWSAYINRNQLKWSQKSVMKDKKLYAPMTFTVDVENQGGTEKNFTIEGLPAWLDATPMNGTIEPLGSQTIMFTVNEGTNVGRYDEVIYVKGDNNVAEGLPVTLKVFDQEPDWSVNPADFKYSMNIYGKLRVNRLFSTDAEDMLATHQDAALG